MALGSPDSSSPGGVWPLPAYHEKLLAKAKRAIQDEQYQLAVVLAHAACEVRMEQALAALCRHKGVEVLAEPIREILGSYNPTNTRVRSLYEALSGDRIAQAPFWPSLIAHAKRRNEVVHRGTRVEPPDAEASLAAAKALIKHVDQVVRSLGQASRLSGVDS